MGSFIAQQLKAKELQLHNKMVMDSYLAIKSKMIKNAAIRHEANHRLIALDSLYKKQDYDALGKMLEDIRHGKSPNEAYEANIGNYGRFANAAKYIDPREE